MNVQFVGVRNLSFTSIADQAELLEVDPEQLKDQLRMTLGVKIGLIADEKLLGISIYTSIHRPDEQTPIVSSENEVLYRIENLSEYAADAGGYSLPGADVLMMTSIALSTVRGFLFGAHPNSLFTKLPLPIVDPKDFVNPDRALEFNTNAPL